MIARNSLAVAVAMFLSLPSNGLAQSTGTVSGSISLATSGQPMHGIRIILSPLGRSVDSSDEGKYEFRDVPPGTYDVIVHTSGLSDERKRVQVTAGTTQTADFQLKLAEVRESVTVTA